MNYKVVRRSYMAICAQCSGSGVLPVQLGLGGYVKCNACNGRGEVLRWLNEIVHDSDDEEGRDE